MTLSPTTTLPSNTTPHGEYYLAKLDSQGALQWVRQEVLTAVESCTDLACSPTGNLVLACSYTGPTTHSGQRFTPRTSRDLLLLSFSAQGTFLWGQTPSLAGAASPASGPVALDGQGNIYTVFSSFQVACYSPGGVLRWQRASPSFVLALAAAAPNQLVLTGCIDGSASFDNIGLTSVGNRDTFVAKLSGPAFSSSPADAGLLAPFIPTIITPNGDGLNDSFRLPGLPTGPWQLRVFSRWGRLIYTVDDYQQDWQAAGLADGQYYYQLQGPSRQQVQGWLEVLH